MLFDWGTSVAVCSMEELFAENTTKYSHLFSEPKRQRKDSINSLHGAVFLPEKLTGLQLIKKFPAF